jgi:colanic acid/amylovoran biosynthesis glycosyltransferase
MPAERDGRRTVAVWRSDWLPRSETFIDNQLGAYRTWRPLRLARREVPAGGSRPEVAPFGDSLASKVAWRLAGVGPYKSTYLRALTSSGAELVHAHFAWDAIAILPVVRASGLPLVATFHGADVTVHRLHGRARYARDGLAEVFEEAAALVAVSEFIAGRLADLGAPADKVVVRPIGVPVGAEPTPGPRAGVLFVGRFVPKKGVTDLVRAYAGLPDRVRAAHPLVLVGDGPERAPVIALAAQLGVALDIRGWRAPAEVAGLMARSAAFCAPSRTAADGDAEGFGMVFLEAARCGLPAVSYRHGGVPEAVADEVTGFLAPEGDVAGLTARLGDILDNPARAAAMGAAGRRRVVEHWDIRTTTPALEAVYDQVAE